MKREQNDQRLWKMTSTKYVLIMNHIANYKGARALRNNRRRQIFRGILARYSFITEPSYSNENLSFKWELQLSIHCHFCPCCLLYCCHPFLPSLLWVNKMEDQRRPQILKSGVQGGCRALSNKIRNHFWIKIKYFCYYGISHLNDKFSFE